MVNPNVVKYSRFVVGLLCAMTCGIFLSFNVYAVPLKETFQFTQTQVELLASFSIGGMGLTFFGALIINKYGYKACYAVCLIAVICSGVSMFVYATYVNFARQFFPLMCFSQLINSVAAAVAEICSIGVGLSLFSGKHVGKITALYLAVTSFGKVYYTFLMEITPTNGNQLRTFFLLVSIGLGLTILLSLLLHGIGDHLVTESSTSNEMTNDYQRINTSESEERTWEIRNMMTSVKFHLLLWSNAFFNGTTMAFMNNLTLVAHPVASLQAEYFVCILAAGIVTSRLIFGISFDYFGTQMSGVVLMMISYTTFSSAMMLCLWCLNDVTIYMVTVLASFGVGPSHSLNIGILTFIFGRQESAFIMSACSIVSMLTAAFTQIIVGQLYENMADYLNVSSQFCERCFHGMYILMLIHCLICAILGSFTLLYMKFERDK